MVDKDNNWSIVIDKFGGYCPGYFDNSYPYYGNKNQASDLDEVNMIDPNVLTQGPGIVALTGGTQAGELGSVLITSITKHAVSSNVAYACGADKVFKITNTAVSNGNFPKTISSGTANVAESCLEYQGKVLVFWNDTGVDGDVGLLTDATTWDDNWGSTVATGAAQLQDAPHYGIVGGDDVAYVTNGKYVATIDATTLNATALDFFDNSETVSVTWNWNRVLMAVNRPNVSGSNFNLSGVYRWNGISSSWEGDPIEVSGEIGALYTKNGTTYIWWKDGISTGGYNFGYINGLRVERIRRYNGSLPNQAQVGEYEGFIGWISSNKLMFWGGRDVNDPVRMFEYAAGTYATVGTWAAPFGSVLISSTASTNYELGKASGYTKDARYKTMAFRVSGPGYKAVIDSIKVHFETLESGAKLDGTLTYNKGASTKALTQLAYSASDASTVRKMLISSPILEDFRIDLSWANGSTSKPFKIRALDVQGHYTLDN